MLEPVAIPILFKAIEFLFGEGSKILEERRERRKAQTQQEAEKGKAEKDAKPALAEKPKAVETIQSKEAALNQPIIENNWSVSESKVKHLLSLLEIYTKNYYLAKEKYAKWGSPLVPPIVMYELEEAEAGISGTLRDLQSVLTTVYGKPVSAPEVESV